jgi:adenylate cyclase, class 2
MTQHGSHTETEIKLRVPDAAGARNLLEGHGFRVAREREFESNVIYDTADQQLRSRGELVRLRRTGDAALLTFKGVSQPGKHKRREELETEVGDAAVLQAVFARLGMGISFQYEKYRTEYTRNDAKGVVTLDETPIGTYLELEGDGDWIDSTAQELGFEEQDYIVSSYAVLYFEHCRRENVAPEHMVFR